MCRHSMEVMLEKIPQAGKVGPMQITHWAIRVGRGPGSVCYEFERNGVKIASSTTCDHGFPMEVYDLGLTEKSHEAIRAWALAWGQNNFYNVAGADFGGKNCQDFAMELCDFLGVGTSKLPWRQARQLTAAMAGGGAVAVGALVLGGALLASCFGPGRRREASDQADDRRRVVPRHETGDQAQAGPGPQEDALEQLLAMGVAGLDARAALEASGDDMNRALAILFPES